MDALFLSQDGDHGAGYAGCCFGFCYSSNAVVRLLLKADKYVCQMFTTLSNALHLHNPMWMLTASPGSRVILLILFLAYSACVTSFSCIVGVVFKVPSPALLLCANTRFELPRQPSEWKVLLRLHDI
jgi:hypothetical protein